MTVRKEKIGVKTGDKVEWREIELEYTHHGPIVSRKDGKAYAVAIPYATEVGLSDQVYEMMTARNLAEMKKALSHLQLMAQNVMVATVQGDIFYVRNGRVPVRAKGVDPTRPVPGNTSATEWQGIHPLSDLVQITNPPSGYMHNNNVTPFAMMKDGTPEPEKYLPYIYNATRTAPRHQRGEMMTELLERAEKVTAEQAIDIAFSPQVYKAELWQERLREAHGKTRKAIGDETEKVYELIQKWNRRSDADSEGAIAYYAFKKSFDPKIARMVEPPPDLSNDAVLEALTKATEWLKTNLGSVTATYGQYFRVGRRGGARTYPVGGGSVSDVAMATPRAISFEKVGNVMVGHGGQTSTQIVIMTNPPKSYAVIPLGQSDHPTSRHWDDQAEKLFSRSKAAPSYFMDRNELMKYVAAKKTLKYQSAARAAR
jgi:acyl-homoserine-lactone acylase